MNIFSTFPLILYIFVTSEIFRLLKYVLILIWSPIHRFQCVSVRVSVTIRFHLNLNNTLSCRFCLEIICIIVTTAIGDGVVNFTGLINFAIMSWSWCIFRYWVQAKTCVSRTIRLSQIKIGVCTFIFNRLFPVAVDMGKKAILN